MAGYCSDGASKIPCLAPASPHLPPPLLSRALLPRSSRSNGLLVRALLTIHLGAATFSGSGERRCAYRRGERDGIGRQCARRLALGAFRGGMVSRGVFLQSRYRNLPCGGRRVLMFYDTFLLMPLHSGLCGILVIDDVLHSTCCCS